MADGGESDLTSSVDGSSFSAVFADLPEGTGTAYNFNANLGVYTLDLGEGENDPHCIAYTVQAANELPPALPTQLRVFGTTDHEALLRWEKSAYRAAQSWEVFVQDNNGIAVSLGVVNTPVFLATNLDAGTTYRFAIKAYTESDGAGVASSMSEWMSVTTKEDAGAAPSFSEPPKSESVQVGTEPRAFTAKAEFGDGMMQNGATLTYQWQRYSANSLAVVGTWENVGDVIAGAAYDEGGNVTGTVETTLELSAPTEAGGHLFPRGGNPTRWSECAQRDFAYSRARCRDRWCDIGIRAGWRGREGRSGRGERRGRSHGGRRG